MVVVLQLSWQMFGEPHPFACRYHSHVLLQCDPEGGTCKNAAQRFETVSEDGGNLTSAWDFYAFVSPILRPPPRICSRRRERAYTGDTSIMSLHQGLALSTTTYQSGRVPMAATRSTKCVAAYSQALCTTCCVAATVLSVTTKARW